MAVMHIQLKINSLKKIIFDEEKPLEGSVVCKKTRFSIRGNYYWEFGIAFLQNEQWRFW